VEEEIGWQRQKRAKTEPDQNRKIATGNEPRREKKT
jgi:hypothetical protein